MDLPKECWELIFNSLHYRYHESLSLVCSSFLSITDNLRHTLVITDQTIPFLSQLLLRFHNLKKIDILALNGDISSVLSQISPAELDLQSLHLSNQSSIPSQGLQELGLKMKNLRELNYSKAKNLQHSDLIVIGDSFPFLEELDISYPEPASLGRPHFPVSDSGVLALSSKLKGLRKINLSGNSYITYHSLVSLSVNCLFLSEIGIHDCYFINQKGIGLALRNIRNLESISFSGCNFPSLQSSLKESFVCARGLRELDLSNSCVPDKLLCLIADASLPLKKLMLNGSCSFRDLGISSVLSKYQSLVYLDLEGANFLTDDSIIEFCKFLRSLTFINLSSCSKLTNSSFFAVLKNCPLVNSIKMETTNVGLGEFSIDIVRKYQVKSLFLSRNKCLNDEFIKKAANIFPCLEVLHLKNCSGITGDGIVVALRSWPGLSYLAIDQCAGINKLDIESPVPKLEVLQAEGVPIADESLVKIGKTCHGLVRLNLAGCMKVTARGVKEVVKHCALLRGINLKGCKNVSLVEVTWLGLCSSSLRKITLPGDVVPTENLKKLFLLHGCLLHEG